MWEYGNAHRYMLCFVNDQVLIAQYYDDINYMTRTLIEEYQKRRLDININDTENMCVGGELRNLMLEYVQKINCCEKYKYLGVNIINEGTLDTAIKNETFWERKPSRY